MARQDIRDALRDWRDAMDRVNRLNPDLSSEVSIAEAWESKMRAEDRLNDMNAPPKDPW